MTRLPFKQVDVFTGHALNGNPVAVVLRADELAVERMQALANWTNLSETTFVLRPTQPGADYRLRIFTSRAELPFAGHPTLGSAHALIEAGAVTPRNGSLVQECAIGQVKLSLHRDTHEISLELPRVIVTPVAPALQAELRNALGASIVGEAILVDVGPKWVTAELTAASAVAALHPDLAHIERISLALGASGVTVFGRTADQTEVRSFAPAHGVPEDPVCGSGNGAVAVFLRATGRAGGYVARQGRCVGRDGHVRIAMDDSAIHLGGRCVTVIDGSIAL